MTTKILTTVNGSVKSERGNEQTTHSFMRSKKLTWRGAERIIRRENPDTTFVVTGLEYMVYNR